jgi:hypothetical protein
VHDSPLVHTTTDQIDEHGNHDDDAEDASGTERLGLCFDTATCVWRAAFEEVYAIVHGRHEGYGGFGERIPFAKE